MRSVLSPALNFGAQQKGVLSPALDFGAQQKGIPSLRSVLSSALDSDAYNI